jgi:CheY-like chemotaxis protein
MVGMASGAACICVGRWWNSLLPGSGNAAAIGSCHSERVALRCLIVDDNSHYGEAARALLEYEGVAVVGLATNGQQAVWLARRFRPDVVLVDVHLGAESGFDLARSLVADARGPVPDVILMSTYDELDFLDLIDASPVVGFLGKRSVSSAAIEELLARADDAGDVRARRGT